MSSLPLIVAAGLLAGTTLAATVATSDFDYAAVPPTHAEVEAALRASSVSIRDAIAAAERHAGGLARSAEMHPTADPPVIMVEVVGNGSGQRVAVSGTDGSVVSAEPISHLPGAYSAGAWSTSDSGLQHSDIAAGTGRTPTEQSTIRFNFTGWLTDGTKIGSSLDRGQPAEAPLAQLIPGWKEGFASMQEGGKRKILVPSALGFGPGQSGIPDGATLTFDLELIKVLDYESIPATAELAGDPVDGQPVTTASGLQYYDIVVGTGPAPSGPAARVKVHYTGWLNDGTKFDSSVDRGQPAEFPLNGVIAGWTEGVGSMRVGGKRKLVIPFALAYGANGRPPTIPARATLVFDVELLEIMP